MKVFQTKSELSDLNWDKIPECRPSGSLLMCTPDYFEIQYAINAHMKDGVGRLKLVDPHRAQSQWQAVKTAFESTGLKIQTIQGQPEFPDMVFSANQALCLPDQQVLLSEMATESRQGEIRFYQAWYKAMGYEVHRIRFEKGDTFEGAGDGLWHYPKRLLWAGYGHRSTVPAWESIAKEFQIPVIALKLPLPEFYHLDTCFSVLSEDTVAICNHAFEEQGLEMIYEVFKNVIEVPLDEAVNHFACNCFCIDGKNVFLQQGTRIFKPTLEQQGFTPHELDTSEYIKAGGSVFCMKQVLVE